MVWFKDLYRKLVRRWRNMGETSRRGHFIRQVSRQRQSNIRDFRKALNKTNYLIYEVHFKLLKLFFFKTWFHVRKMAIVSVSSHSLSTRIDCSVFSLRRSKSSLMVIRVATGTFIYALMRLNFYSKVCNCYVCPWKAKKNWALVHRNDFLKRDTGICTSSEFFRDS